MSRALPEAERRSDDTYYTPDELAEALVSLLPIGAMSVCWEPHAGGGAFVRALDSRTACPIVATDLHGWGAPLDFLSVHSPPPGTSWIVGNPPFRGHEQHIDKALDLSPNVAFLLRLAVMESAARVPMWRRWPLRKVWVLAERPSFTGGGTDCAAYGFFWWDRAHRGPAEIVPGWSWK